MLTEREQAERVTQVAAGENPPYVVSRATATDISRGREMTPEGGLKNEASVHAYSSPRSVSTAHLAERPDVDRAAERPDECHDGDVAAERDALAHTDYGVGADW